MEILFSHERLGDFLLIEEMLFSNRLLIDPLDSRSDHPCRLVNYSLETESEFRCLLDRNVVSYLIELAKGRKVTTNKDGECFRLTAALQAFLNASGIMSEPSMAYHEYMESSGLEKADKELSLFRSADNLNANIYLDIAIGKRSSVPDAELVPYEAGELVNAEIPPKLRHFENNIVIVKKALSLKSKGNTDYQVLLDLMDWIYENYVFSAPAFHFLSIYFSSKRISQMLKSRSITGIRNATWDLCLIQQMITNVKDSDNTNVRWLLSTFDQAVKETTDYVFLRYDESVDDYYSRLETLYSEMWGKKNNYGNNLLNKLVEFNDSVNDPQRNINRHKGSSEYILSLRKEVEREFQACEIV
ncbi:hypothetical protein [Methylohalobius crimeensis]|uniref:hypothetical protein n=1 Tax=Methylohalobius crimeensis TaxID=244365 RepID=UPI0003B41294|nr:hypothetical protein [Methylohalobius crimeensis]